MMQNENLQFPEYTDGRSEQFNHNEKLNALLSELRDLLTPVQKQINKQFVAPKWPIGLIIGPPRSGSTVFLQFLASTENFAYPTNLLTRFANAPYIGALIQKLLFSQEYDYQDEFADLRHQFSFTSDLGKCKGALATNEFFHFWRQYLGKFFPEPLTPEELQRIDYTAIASSLASIEAAFKKPFCSKGMLQQFNLNALYSMMPYSFFIRIVRKPLFISQSLLISREKYYGNRTTWWSAKPKEYSWLKDLDNYHQVTGQVYFTEKAITDGLKDVPDSNQITVEYEAFCDDPKAVYLNIAAKYSDLGCELPLEYKGPTRFKCGNDIRLPAADIDALQAAYKDFENGLFDDQ